MAVRAICLYPYISSLAETPATLRTSVYWDPQAESGSKLDGETYPEENTGRGWVLSAASLLVINWISMVVMDPDPPGSSVLTIGYFLGSLHAHASLAGVLAALGPGKLHSRLAISFVWLIALPFAPAISFGLYGGPGDAAFEIGVGLFGQWVLVLLLLAPIVWRTDMSVARPVGITGLPRTTTNQFGILDVMILMSVAAVLLTIGRTVLPWLSQFGHELAAFLFLAVAAVILTLPVALTCLMKRFAIVGIALSVLQIVVGTYYELTIMHDVAGVSGPNIYHLIGINTVAGALILLTMLLVRAQGYRLSTSRNLFGRLSFDES